MALSLLIVMAASVALYRPEVGRSNRPQIPRSSPPDAPPPVPASPSPAPKREEPPKASREAAPARPRAAFDRVREGETFSDVARRVYGDAADVQAFWKVNRDQVPTPDAEVRPGMVLRTPDL